MNLGYIRCSTALQNEDRQYKGLESYGIEKFFEDKLSGKDMNRPKLQELLEFIREGDVIYIWELSRISRSTKDLLDIAEIIQSKGAKLISVKESIVIGDESNPMSKFITNVMIALYEMERETIVERTREGVAIAKQAGKYKGRKPREFDIGQLKEYKKKIDDGEYTVTYVAKQLGITRSTLYRKLDILRDMEADASE